MAEGDDEAVEPPESDGSSDVANDDADERSTDSEDASERDEKVETADEDGSDESEDVTDTAEDTDETDTGEDNEETDTPEDTDETDTDPPEPDSDATETDGGGAFEGAPDDQEMPLTVHIEEMLKRLAAVIVVMGGVSLIIFPVAPDLINWLWYSFLPGNPEACVNGNSDTTACPRVYHPLGLLFARIKVASLVGFVIALPVFVYQTYLFMRPGLYPHERRYYLAAVPTSLLLAFVGLSFAYFLVLPFIFTYFLFYSQDVAEIAFGLTETFDLILLMMGLFAAIFQIPLFIMLAIMMGVTTRTWLEEKRYYFWLGFAGFAFLFSPDPTGMAPFMVGITMVILYELTLLLLRWTGR